jgi:hypothetical protein
MLYLSVGIGKIKGKKNNGHMKSGTSHHFEVLSLFYKSSEIT